MAGYNVAMWLRSENIWPEIVLDVQAETASDAVIVVLRTRRVRRAVKVVVSAGDWLPACDVFTDGTAW